MWLDAKKIICSQLKITWRNYIFLYDLNGEEECEENEIHISRGSKTAQKP